MTRHNLPSHISWLLSREVTLLVGVPAATSTNSTAAIEVSYADLQEEGTEHQIRRGPSTLAPNRQLARAVNVNTCQDFLRPPPPSTSARKLQPREPTDNFADDVMGKLESASKPTRPGIVSQHQLATPASTTGSTSSLMQGYSALLRANGTPSSKPTVERLPSNFSRSLQTPQTPRQTPRPTSRVKHGPVESVDLTGDDDGHRLSSRSSSTEVIFSEPQMLWREDYASRPEPILRKGKKRKSDEISEGNSPGKARSGGPLQLNREERGDSEDFVDIDDMVDVHSQSNPFHVDKIRSRPVQQSIDVAQGKGDFEEQYSVTETISRVETRTRKSVSHMPSGCEVSATVSGSSSPPTLPFIGSQAKSGSVNKSTSQSIVQITASPTATSPKESASVPDQTPQKRKRFRQEETIQDSDDEEIFSLERQTGFSPRLPVSCSPRIIDTLGNPEWQDIPASEIDKTQGNDVRKANRRFESPLRPLSRNIGMRQDRVPSPFQRDSPTKVPPTNRPLQQPLIQLTPSSTLPADEKKLVSLFLNHPIAISSYQLRVANLIKQNAVTSMSYIDEGEVAPAELVEERKMLLDMNKAYAALENLAEHYRNKIAEKKNLVRKICELLDVGVDTSLHEERSSSLTQDLRKMEIETGKLLLVSGAIEDGFGTELNLQDGLTAPVPSSMPRDSHGARAQGSSATGSAQIIFQTQIPSQQHNSASGSIPPTKENFPPNLISRPGFELGANSFDQGRESPSRVPLDLSKSRVEQHQLNIPQNNWQNPGLKQPNFYRDPPPIDSGFDGFDGFDGDDDLFRLLEDEQEILQISARKSKTPDPVGNEYGDCDDDDDYMAGIAQEVEQRHSFNGSRHGLPRQVPFVTSASTPEPPKRTRPTASKTMYSHVDPETTELLRHPWSKDVKKALKDRFKLTGFRHHQLEAINATLGGKHAFVLMPTGGGKSLCYQLPAVVQSGETKGVSIVISPLLSLMTDQVGHLQKLNIRAATLNSEVPAMEKDKIMNYLRESHPEQFIQLLYITPEMITKSQKILNALSGLYRRQKLARIVIDEAHCVSQWGHDFRPDYVALGEVRKRFPEVPFMALTATATENVKIDVMHSLGMKDAAVYSQSFNRPNLHYEVRSKKGKGKAREILGEIADLIKTKYANQTGIIYTLSRKGCEQMAEKLRKEYKIKVHHYHASMKPADKLTVQRNWQNGILKVVVATIAFGMGIDKPDVRFVIHHTIPKSLEGYYQETGRAGRDGKKSGCYLYYGYQDTAILKNFIYESDGSPEQKERQRKMLSSMVQYCENRCDCRRVQVLAYFGEAFAKEECDNTCDNCNSDAIFETVDFSTQARAALNIVKRVQDCHVTLLHCVDILRGVTSAKIKKMEHNSVQDFGVASDIPRGEVERLFYRLLLENALAEHNVINGSGFPVQYLNLGPNCRDFMQGRRKLKVQVKVSASPPAGPKPNQPKPAQKSARSAAMCSSTAVTSPLSGASRRRKPASRRDYTVEDSRSYIRDDIVASDPDEDEEEFFEHVRDRRQRAETPGDNLGPPITTDERMENLPELHRVFVHQFVEEAKKEAEWIRNLKNLKKPLFTESNLREMAINWTLTLDDMRQIQDINVDGVNSWGKKFIPIIERYSRNYDDAMDQTEDRDMDKNHQNVIDLCSDEADFDLEDDEDGDDHDDNDDNDEETVLRTERGSKYFPNLANASSSNYQATLSQDLPLGTGNDAKAAMRKKNYVGGSGFPFKGRFRGGKKGGTRRSNSSGFSQNHSGVTKRKSSAGAQKLGSIKSGSSKQSDLMKTFGNNGGSGRGGGRGTGGGIAMMPT